MFAELVAEVAGWSDEELVVELRRLEADDRSREARWAALLAEADRRRLYAADGHASIAGMCRAVLRWGHGLLARRRRLAALCELAPQVGDALLDASVGVSQANAMAKAHANPRCGDEIIDVVDVLVEQASKLPCSEFEIVVARWERLADQQGALRDAHHAVEHRDAVVTTFAGVLHVEARGGAVDAAVMAEVFDRFLEAEVLHDWGDARATYGDAATKQHLARTDAQRRFDALRAIFDAAAVAPAGGRPPEPSVVIMIDIGTWEDVLAHERLVTLRPDRPPTDFRNRFCETTRGIPLTPHDVLQAAVAGSVRRAVFDTDSTIIDFGRRARLFTGAAARAVRLRSRRCTYAGCEVPATRSQLDHLEEWGARAGPTDQRNGAPTCARHNRWRNHGYRVRCDDDGTWHTCRPDGTEIT